MNKEEIKKMLCESMDDVCDGFLNYDDFKNYVDDEMIEYFKREAVKKGLVIKEINNRKMLICKE